MNNLLWTGGWDSTFRLLDLVFNKKIEVQPHYIIDKDRPSLKREIDAMKKIREMVKEKDEDLGSLIRETIFVNVEDISKNEIITSYYKKLLSRSHIGSQYEWLARYVDSMGINNLELCNHKDGTIYNFIKDDVYFVEEENDSYYKIKEELLRPELRMFKKFRFPILDLTKIDMGEIAKKSGFFDIMQETWFCHRPTRRGTPCGWCNPCKVTREQGLSNRVPTKLVGFLNNVDRKLTRYFQKR